MSGESKINVLKGRKITLDGAALIGTGALGKVYLLPDDNVVKVLKGTDFKMAEKEILRAKWAFSKGLPTAISYDVVDIDGHPGLVYESLGRDNLRNRLRDQGDKTEQILKQYLAFIKDLNGIVAENGQLPSAKRQMLETVKERKGFFSDQEYDRIMTLVASVPEDDHLIHGDCHMKNIKIVNDRMYLIDLDTLACGDPIFELAGLCCAYRVYDNADENGYNTFFEIDDQTVKNTYFYLTDNYFPNIGNKGKRDNLEKIEAFTYLVMFCRLNPVSDREMFERILPKIREGLYKLSDFVLCR